MEIPHGSKEISFSIEGQQDVHRSQMVPPVEKEHMFDKVVTPSDVGKLNRLVLPKQHAEKYFPLDSSVSDKGLLLCFEDHCGKPWRFRYSYWNSSQSYVITKGWSLFVKKHCLNAGDTVSFARGSGNAAHDHLFIDCKRRQQTVDSAGGYQHSNPNLSFNRSPFVPCGSTLGGGRQYIYFPSSATVPRVSVQDRVLDSVPVVRGQKAAKRVRLFGVNLDCPDSDCGPQAAELQPMLDFHHLQLRLKGSSEGKHSIGSFLDVNKIQSILNDNEGKYRS